MRLPRTERTVLETDLAIKLAQLKACRESVVQTIKYVRGCLQPQDDNKDSGETFRTGRSNRFCSLNQLQTLSNLARSANTLRSRSALKRP